MKNWAKIIAVYTAILALQLSLFACGGAGGETSSQVGNSYQSISVVGTGSNAGPMLPDGISTLEIKTFQMERDGQSATVIQVPETKMDKYGCRVEDNQGQSFPSISEEAEGESTHLAVGATADDVNVVCSDEGANIQFDNRDVQLSSSPINVDLEIIFDLVNLTYRLSIRYASSQTLSPKHRRNYVAIWDEEGPNLARLTDEWVLIAELSTLIDPFMVVVRFLTIFGRDGNEMKLFEIDNVNVADSNRTTIATYPWNELFEGYQAQQQANRIANL